MLPHIPALRKALLLLPLLPGCAAPSPDHVDAGMELAVRAEMARQEAAWDAGDIPGFMAGYAPEVCFVSRADRTCGRDSVTRRYQRRYPDRAAMGDLRFTISEVLPAGTGHAWCTGSWTLVRAADTLDGGFSLLWQKRPEGWRIVRDHTY